MAQINCPANQWTQVLWTAGPTPYTSTVRFAGPGWYSYPRVIKIRRNSGGPPWHWEGQITSGALMYFWHSPADWYASIDVCPVDLPATIEALPFGTFPN